MRAPGRSPCSRAGVRWPSRLHAQAVDADALVAPERQESARWKSDAGLSGEALLGCENQQSFQAGLSGDQVAAQTGQQAFAANMPGDMINTYGANRHYVDALRQNHLSNMTNRGAARLTYRDAAFQTNQPDRWNNGMAPAQFGMDWANRWARHRTEDVRYEPPQPFIPYSFARNTA